MQRRARSHAAQGMLAAMFVKQRIELDFQVDDFLENAKDAFYMGAHLPPQTHDTRLI